MTREAPCARPPRIAVWLVDLFASENQAESILGDLLEEFSDLASKSGVVSARRWFWRQSVKTVAHLAGAGLRAAPSSTAGTVLIGLLLLWFGSGLPERTIVAILRTQTPYSNLHYDFYVWMMTRGIPIVRVVESLLIGSIVAALAKGREMVVTITLSLVRGASIAWLFFLFVRMAPHRPEVVFLWSFLFECVVNLTAIVIAGAIVRKVRSASARRLSATCSVADQ
jgi:hypothetical protein